LSRMSKMSNQIEVGKVLKFGLQFLFTRSDHSGVV
jgi:hypothetical protein